MRIKSGFPILPVLLVAALGGCGGGGGTTEPGGTSLDCAPTGTVSANVTGAVTASLNGCSIFVVSTATPGGTSISLVNGTFVAPTHSMTLGRQGPRPATGTYTIGIGAANWNGAFLFKNSPNDREFDLTSGTVTITASSNSTLSGTFSAVGTQAIAGSPTVNISGSFSAKCSANTTTVC